jgi:hypothetical protein
MFLGYVLKFLFLISSFNIRLLGLKIHDFFRFLFCGINSISYLKSWVSQINPDWLMFFFQWFFQLNFFFSFVFHYLVCLRVGLHYFIQFVLYKIILLSWLSYKFGMLTRVRFFHSFLKLIFLVCFKLYFFYIFI